MLEKSGHISSTRVGLILFLLIHAVSFIFFTYVAMYKCKPGIATLNPHFFPKKKDSNFKVFSFEDEHGQRLETVIRTFENFTASELHGEKALNCGICLADFEKKSLVTSLKCDSRHIFHAECLLPWLHEKNEPTCPTCRSPIEKVDI